MFKVLARLVTCSDKLSHFKSHTPYAEIQVSLLWSFSQFYCHLIFGLGGWFLQNRMQNYAFRKAAEFCLPRLRMSISPVLRLLSSQFPKGAEAQG